MKKHRHKPRSQKGPFAFLKKGRILKQERTFKKERNLKQGRKIANYSYRFNVFIYTFLILLLLVTTYKYSDQVIFCLSSITIRVSGIASPCLFKFSGIAAIPQLHILFNLIVMEVILVPFTPDFKPTLQLIVLYSFCFNGGKDLQRLLIRNSVSLHCFIQRINA